ncbi:MAG: N-acetylneuraminate synthase family protein, partial [Nitrososphaerales archaeon]
ELVRSALDMCPRVYISLGGISVEELEKLLADHRILPSERICLMYGFQAEPTPIESNNLRRLGALKTSFPGYRLGFMDHSKGSSDEAMTLALMALSFGVDCIEKHLTLDPTLELEDYVSALPPERFRLFVERIRNLEKALGTDDLELTATELEYRKKAMKVVVSNENLDKDEAVRATNLSLKRTSSSGSSSSIYRIEDVVGRRLKVDVGPNQQLTEEMLS